MESSDSIVHRLAGLTGHYEISDENANVKVTRNTQTRSKGLTLKELKSYQVFPIINIGRNILDNTGQVTTYGDITYLQPNNVIYQTGSFQDHKINLATRFTIKRSKITDPTGDDIVFICRNSISKFDLPSQDFWCESIDSDYISAYTDLHPLSDRYEGKYLWYYGKKIGRIGGRPRRRSTFRQRRLKRTTSKSRRATRRRV